MQCKQMGPVVINGSVHTACKQHQRKKMFQFACGWRRASCVNWALVSKANFSIRQKSSGSGRGFKQPPESDTMIRCARLRPLSRSCPLTATPIVTTDTELSVFLSPHTSCKKRFLNARLLLCAKPDSPPPPHTHRSEQCPSNFFPRGLWFRTQP